MCCSVVMLQREQRVGYDVVPSQVFAVAWLCCNFFIRNFTDGVE